MAMQRGRGASGGDSAPSLALTYAATQYALTGPQVTQNRERPRMQLKRADIDDAYRSTYELSFGGGGRDGGGRARVSPRRPSPEPIVTEYPPQVEHCVAGHANLVVGGAGSGERRVRAEPRPHAEHFHGGLTWPDRGAVWRAQPVQREDKFAASLRRHPARERSPDRIARLLERLLTSTQNLNCTLNKRPKHLSRYAQEEISSEQVINNTSFETDSINMKHDNSYRSCKENARLVTNDKTHMKESNNHNGQDLRDDPQEMTYVIEDTDSNSSKDDHFNYPTVERKRWSHAREQLFSKNMPQIYRMEEGDNKLDCDDWQVKEQAQQKSVPTEMFQSSAAKELKSVLRRCRPTYEPCRRRAPAVGERDTSRERRTLRGDRVSPELRPRELACEPCRNPQHTEDYARHAGSDTCMLLGWNVEEKPPPSGNGLACDECVQDYAGECEEGEEDEEETEYAEKASQATPALVSRHTSNPRLPHSKPASVSTDSNMSPTNRGSSWGARSVYADQAAYNTHSDTDSIRTVYMEPSPTAENQFYNGTTSNYTEPMTLAERSPGVSRSIYTEHTHSVGSPRAGSVTTSLRSTDPRSLASQSSHLPTAIIRATRVGPATDPRCPPGTLADKSIYTNSPNSNMNKGNEAIAERNSEYTKTFKNCGCDCEYPSWRLFN